MKDLFKRTITDKIIGVSPAIALALGVGQSMILQQLHFWLTADKVKMVNGQRWIKVPHKRWAETIRCYSEGFLRAIITDLEKSGILVSAYHGKGWDRTKSYRIDYEALSTAMNAKLPEVHTVSPYADHLRLDVQESCTSLIEKESSFKNLVRPSAVTPEETKNPTDEINNMKTASSADAILSRLRQKNSSVKPKTTNTAASAIQLWRHFVPLKNEGVGMLPEFTQKQRGQFSLFVKRCGPTSDEVIEHIASHWIAFTKYVKSAKALKGTPDLPDIGFALLYLGEARDFKQQSVQSIALAPRKPLTSVGKSLTIRPPMKGSAPAQPTVPAPKAPPPKAETENEKEDVASLDFVLNWKPVKKE